MEFRVDNGPWLSVTLSSHVWQADVPDDLKMGFMGAFEARKNKWPVLTDVLYLNFSANNAVESGIPVGPITIPVTTSAKLDWKGLVLHFACGYNLYTDGKSKLELVGGTRNLDMDLFLALQSLGPGQSRTISDSIDPWDAFIGLKGQCVIGER